MFSAHPASSHRFRARRRVFFSGPKTVPTWLKRLGLVVLLFVMALTLSLGVLIWFVFKFQPQELYQFVVVPATIEEQGKQAYLVWFSTVSNRVVLVELSTEMTYALVGGYGEYKLGAVYPLLKLDNRPPTFITSVYSFAFRRAIEDVYAISLEHVQANFQSIVFGIISDSHTSLRQKIEAARVLKLYQQVPITQREFYSISDHEQWKKIAKLIDVPADQDCAVAVINGTTVSGLATSLAGILEESGAVVIRSSNASEIMEQSSFYLDNEMSCHRYLTHIQAVLPQKLEAQVKPELTRRFRADVVMEVGEDVGNVIKSVP